MGLKITGNALITVENGSYQLRLDHNTNRELIEALGTSTLPLPFTSLAAPELVLEHTRAIVGGSVRMAV